MTTLTSEQRRRRWQVNSITLTIAGILFLLLSLVGWTSALWLFAVVCTLVGALALVAGVAGFRRLRTSPG